MQEQRGQVRTELAQLEAQARAFRSSRKKRAIALRGAQAGMPRRLGARSGLLQLSFRDLEEVLHSEVMILGR